MAIRHPGPLGLFDQWVNTDDGTTSRTYQTPLVPVGTSVFDEYLLHGREARMCVAPPPARAQDPWLFNLGTFITLYEKEKPPFGKLSPEQRAGLEEVMGFIRRDRNITDLRWIAYMLATLMHECRSAASKWVLTWKPVSETGGANKSYGKEVVVTDWKGNPLGSDGKPIQAPRGKGGKALPIPENQKIKRRYYGRGYVQITHQENYRAMDDALGLNKSLLLNPERALEPAISYKIMSYGMREGSFMGKKQRSESKGYYGGNKLGDYVSAASADYFNARSIINADKNKTETGSTVSNGMKVKGYADKFETILKASRIE